jgi:hypothetical protein
MRAALLRFDPKLPPEEVNRLLARGLRVDSLNDELTSEVEDFILFLRQGIIRRFSKPRG